MRLLGWIRTGLASRSGIVLAVVLAAVLGTATLAFAAPGLLGPAQDELSSGGDRPPEIVDPPAGTGEPGPNDEGGSGAGDQGQDGSTSEGSQEGSAGGDGEVQVPATVTCMGQPATIEGTDDAEKIDGTGGPDVIVAGEGNDTVDSGGGDDVVCGGDGDGDRTDDFVDDDDIRAGSGDDRVDGQLGNDRIRGGDGDDTLFGDEGESGERTMILSTADDLDGGEGEDTLDGGGDQDVVLGSEDSDSIESADDGSIDVVIGGRSSDQCSRDDDDDVSECEGDGTVETPDSGDRGGGDGGGNGRGRENDDDDEKDSVGGLAGSAPLPLFCLPQTARLGKLRIGSLFLGGNVVETLVGAGELPLPLAPRRSLSFCVEGGGVVLVAFSPIGRAEIILSTGPGRSARGVNPGDRAGAIRRSYSDAVRIHSPARHSGASLYRASPTSRLIFGVRGGRVVFVGMASRVALADGDLLAQYLREIPLPRGT